MTRLHTVALLLGLAGFAAVAAAQDCYDYRETFRVAEPFPMIGSVAAMVTDQDRALLARGYDLVFLDIENPDAVSTLGTRTLGEAPLLVASAGFLAAVASDNSLMMVDWSDPENTQITLAMSLPVGTRSLTRQGDILLVSRGEYGVRIFECTEDGGLQFLGDVDTPGVALEAVVHDGWLVVADTSALLAVDITNPAAPTIVDIYDDYWVSAGDRFVRQVQADGGDLVVAAIRWHGGELGGPTEGLDLMNVSPSGQLALDETTYCIGGWPEYDVSGGLLHVSAYDTYIIYDLASFPARAVVHETGILTARPLVAGGNTALHRLSGSEFDVYDIRYPFYQPPQPAWSGSAFHDIAHGQLEPGWVLKTKTVWSGMVFTFYTYTYDVRNPEAIVELEEWHYSGYYDDYAFAGICASDAKRILLYVNTPDFNGCRMSDLRTGSEIITWLPYSGNAVIAGNRVYQKAQDWDPRVGLACLDIAAIGAVTEIGFRYGAVSGPLLALDENILVIQEGGLKIVDFSNPAQPVDRGTLPGVTGQYVARRGDRLYLSHDYGHLAAVDIADLDALSLIWDSGNLGGSIGALEFSGDLAAVAINGAGDSLVRIYDMSDDVAGPVAVSPAFATGSYLHGLLWDGDILYTGDLQVYDLAEPGAPALLGRGDGAWSDLYRQGDGIVTSAGVYPVQCAVTGVEEGETIPGPVALLDLRVAPNPFNPQTTVSFVAPTNGEVQLSLHDLAGRRVRVLLHTNVAAGRQVVPWNGRDDQGRPLASGVYFARLEMGSLRETVKLVLVK